MISRGPRRGVVLSTGVSARRYSAKRCRIDDNRRRRHASSGQDLGEQPAKGMPNNRGLTCQSFQGSLLVHGSPGESYRFVWVLLPRVQRPAWGDRDVASLLKQLCPLVPAGVE